MMAVQIIGLSISNLGSVYNFFKHFSGNVSIVTKPDQLVDNSLLVLPGNGHFAAAAAKLESLKFSEQIVERANNKSNMILGICLGMHILFNGSEEAPEAEGLGLIAGNIKKLRKQYFSTVPHVGWNECTNIYNQKALSCADYYFIHNYYCPVEHIKDADSYGMVQDATPIVGWFKKANVIGCQFHPEKSGIAGRQLISNAVGLSPTWTV